MRPQMGYKSAICPLDNNARVEGNDWLEIGLELLPPVFFLVTVAVVIPAIKAATTMAIIAVLSLWFLTQTRTLDRVIRIGEVSGIWSIGKVFKVISII